MPENHFGEASLSFDEPLDLSASARVMSNNHESSTPATSKLQTESGQVNEPVGRSPAQCEQAFGVFVRKLTEEFLDHRLPISQQSYQNLTHIENACRRSFPQYDARQIRLKVRAQLKLYRRQVKKSSEKTKQVIRQTDKPRTLLPLDFSGTVTTVPVCQSGELPTPIIAYCDGPLVKETLSCNAASTYDTTLLKDIDFQNPENTMHFQTGPPEAQPAVSICEGTQEPRMDGGHQQNMSAPVQADNMKFFVPTDLTKTSQMQESEERTLTLNYETIRPPNVLATSLRMSAGILIQTAKLFEVAGLTAAAAATSLRYPSVKSAFRNSEHEATDISLDDTAADC